MRYFLLASLIALPARGSGDESVEHWESYTPKAGQAIEMTDGSSLVEVAEPLHDYSYSSFGKPNPFIPPATATHLAKLEIPVVSVLQKYRMEQLKTVGLWSLENGDRRALIMTPKDEGVIVELGDPIGSQGGKVVNIDQNSVKTREFVIAADGTRQFQDYTLWLGDEAPKEQEKIVISPGKGQRPSDEHDFLESRGHVRGPK